MIDSFGPYRVVSLLGQGGMGVVYCGEEESTGRRVAIKTVSSVRENELSSIRREIHALTRLDHPGVVHIYGQGLRAGVPWYAMELLDNQNTLRRFVRGGRAPEMSLFDEEPTLEHVGDIHATPEPVKPAPAPPKRPEYDGEKIRPALTALYRLCRTLAYVHGRGIVHRDLKPENVMMRDDGTPVLTDFGLVAQFRGAWREVLDVTEAIAGTASYLAPEQARGEQVDARADLYAVGVMLYELIAGRPPFAAATLTSMLHQLTTLAPPPLSNHVDNLPRPLEELVMRLLAKSPRQRFGYAEEIASALRELGAEDGAAKSDAAGYLYSPQLEGRSDVLQQLRQYSGAVRNNMSGGLVLVSGESGVGKTSVVAAMARTAAVDGLTVITGECVPVSAAGASDRAGPLHPFRPFLRRVADRCLEFGPVATERLLGPRAIVLAQYEPALLAVIGNAADANVSISADAARRRLFSDLAETLAAAADDRPMLLVLDDLQWADELTLQFLTSLPDDFFDKRSLLIAGTYRAEEVSLELRSLIEKPNVRRVELTRLDEKSVGGIVQSMLALESLRGATESLTHFLAAQSEGNPFFVAEYLRAALGEQVIYRDHGEWRVRISGDGRPLHEALQVPGSLRDLVTQRLEKLSDSAQLLVEIGAVLGRDFDESLLAAIGGLPDEKRMEALTELVDRHVLEETQRGRFSFAHDKLREAAYGRLAAERRRDLHAAAALAIEQQYADTLSDHYIALARHWDVARVDTKAIDYADKAASKALQTGAARQAADLLTRALELDEPNTNSDRVRRARWYRQLSGAYFGLGDFDACGDAASRGMELLGVHAPKSRAARTLALLRNAGEQTGRLLISPGLFRARSTRWEALEEAANATQRLAERQYFAADALGMLTSGLLSVNLAERSGRVAPVARTYAMLGLAAGSMGFGKLARMYCRRGADVARRSDDLPGLAYSLYAEASFDLGIGEWDASREHAEAALEVAERVRDQQEIEVIHTIRAHVAYYTGSIQEAYDIFRGIRESAQKRNALQHEAWGCYAGARSLIALGRTHDAIEHIERALQLLAQQAEHPSSVICNGLLAVARLERGEMTAAREAADEGMRLVRQSVPAIWEMFRAHVGALEVYLETGEMEPVPRILKELKALARRFPMAWSSYHRLRGRASHDEASLHRAVEAAKQTPLDEAMARFELARSARDAGVRRENAVRACELFARMRCTWWLRRVDDLMRNGGMTP